jgi:small subunit ribosomal protein S20
MSIQKAKSHEKQSQNRKYKTLIKNQFKKFENCLKGGGENSEELKKITSEAQKVLDKASNKKIIHQNKAARQKSKLHSLLNKLNKKKEVTN